ncbi:MAG TPA: hypothetical protein VF275_10785 [Gammaproteobacteria bacterium]
MTEQIPAWRPCPTHVAHVTHQLCMALSDLIVDEAGGEMSRRSYLKLCGLAMAAEVFSAEVARFFGNQEGEDEAVLAALEARYSRRNKVAGDA